MRDTILAVLVGLACIVPAALIALGLAAGMAVLFAAAWVSGALQRGLTPRSETIEDKARRAQR
jgi:hypothetical protein